MRKQTFEISLIRSTSKYKNRCKRTHWLELDESREMALVVMHELPALHLDLGRAPDSVLVNDLDSDCLDFYRADDCHLIRLSSLP